MSLNTSTAGEQPLAPSHRYDAGMLANAQKAADKLPVRRRAHEHLRPPSRPKEMQGPGFAIFDAGTAQPWLARDARQCANHRRMQAWLSADLELVYQYFSIYILHFFVESFGFGFCFDCSEAENKSYVPSTYSVLILVIIHVCAVSIL